jgi:MscS family membrane protein
MNCHSNMIFSALAVLAICTLDPAVAQVPSPPPEASEATVTAPTAPAVAPTPEKKDALGRETPEGLVRGLLKAMADQDYKRAAQYLDLSSMKQSLLDDRGSERVRELQELLDKGGWLSANWQLSSEPTGNLDDGLPPNQEKFATVRTPRGMIGLIAERKDDPIAGQIWLVSSETIGQIPQLLEQVQVGVLDRIMPDLISYGPRVGGVPIGHWLALLILAASAYVASSVITRVGIFCVQLVWPRSRGPRAVRLLQAAILPFRLYLAVWIFAIGTVFLGVSVIARQQLGYLAEIIAWITLAWLLWRIVDAAGELTMERMSRHRQLGALAALRFIRRAAKFVIGAVAVIAALNTLGFNVTTGLAALGIGGIAVALGAQKTIENLVGSLTLIGDQPVRVGDFCRFGDILGTVEDIGMRSTRIRTLDRTVVVIPNGEFSSLKIENYSRRDRFWFHPTLGLRYETTPDQIRYLLVELRSMLYAHPRVDPDPARVRFVGLGAESLNIEIFAYVHAENQDDFLEVQEDLTLRIMDIVAESGTSFAFPSRTLYLAKDAMAASDKRNAAENRVREWSEKGELQLPRFQSERIAALQGTLSYPPEGAASRASESASPGLPFEERTPKQSRNILRWGRQS